MSSRLRVIYRQLVGSSRQALVFVLCVSLSLTTLTAFSGFARSVRQSLLADARTLHAADIILGSGSPFNPHLQGAVAREAAAGRIESTRIHTFFSVVRTVDADASLLARLKVVEPAYPFYGEVVLLSGRTLAGVLTQGSIVVEQLLLDRLGLAVGDLLQVGFTTLRIVDVVTAEPDRPVNMFAFGPRVFVSHQDLDALGLIEKGSRIRYRLLIKVTDPQELAPLAAHFKTFADPERERVDTYRTARSGVRRFLDNFIFFLKLVGIFILVLAGMGIQSTLGALLREKRQTIAVMKTLGATSRYVQRYFMKLTALMGGIGILLGVAVGLGLQWLLYRLLADFLPPSLHFQWAPSGVLEGIAVGVVVLILFTLLPLHQLRYLRPVMIFRRDQPVHQKRWPAWLSAAALLLFFFGLTAWHMADAEVGLYLVAGVGGVILISASFSQLSLWVLKRLTVRRLAVRQAVRGLFRPGNATRPVMITLTTSLAVIFAIFLIEANLDATFVRSFPADAPNLFFVDIQPDQRDGFARLVDQAVTFYPVIRARVTAVNDEAIDRERQQRTRGDSLARTMNLTYRETLLDTERLISGERLYRSDWQEPQVSVLDEVLEMHPMKVGDRLRFRIQGVPLTARISSIRTRVGENLSPFFYFVFPTDVLGNAPQTVFTALRVPPDAVADLQTRLVTAYPNVSVIDLSTTLRVLARLMQRLSNILRSFTALSIVAGVLILTSAIWATRAQRMTEAVYYKVLGARRRFVLQVFTMENLLIAAMSGILALLMAHLCAGVVCHLVFDIRYQAFALASGGLVLGNALLVVTTGLLASWAILKKKPVTYLREQTDG
ncbi:MAG: FtsX-like permease family protein [Desulfosarcinaceae bacterium]|nr:FtsX-like permease family protein [Desulfosarcinaceae bacterium]